MIQDNICICTSARHAVFGQSLAACGMLYRHYVPPAKTKPCLSLSKQCRLAQMFHLYAESVAQRGLTPGSGNWHQGAHQIPPKGSNAKGCNSALRTFGGPIIILPPTPSVHDKSKRGQLRDVKTAPTQYTKRHSVRIKR